MDDVMICRCHEVMKSEIEMAIADGATTIDGVKRRTCAGMGLCQGKTCQRLVANIIAEKTGKPMGELVPPTFRVPVRPIKITILAGESDED